MEPSLARILGAVRFHTPLEEFMKKLNLTSIDIILSRGSGPGECVEELAKMAGKEGKDEVIFLDDELRAMWGAAKAVETRHAKEDVWALTTGLHVPPRKARKVPSAKPPPKAPAGVGSRRATAAPPKRAAAAVATAGGLPSLRNESSYGKMPGFKKI